MKYIIIYIYVAINIFLLILNWNLFSSSINIDLGFGVFNIPPLVLIQIIGLVALVIFALLDGVKDLKREVLVSDLQKQILSLEKDSIINVLKDKIKSKTEPENKEDSKTENLK